MSLRKKTQLDQALEQARDRASELVERAAPHMEQARDRLVEDYLPAAQDAVSTARETVKDTVIPAAAAAMTQAGSKLTEMGESAGRKPRRSRFKKFLAAAGVVGIGAAVAKALSGRQGGRQGGSTAYSPVPSPAPTPASPPPTQPTPDPEAPMATAMTPQETTVEPAADEAPADEAGSGFDEALADEQEHPHAVTTPDNPAETIDVSEEKTPKG